MFPVVSVFHEFRFRTLRLFPVVMLVIGTLVGAQTKQFVPPTAPRFDPQSCVSQTKLYTQVNMLTPAATEQSWLWDVHRRTKMLPLGCSSIDGNIWSVNSADGGVTMRLNQGLTTSAQLHNIKNHGAIVGYPEILYGYKPFGSILTAQSEVLAFPIHVSAFPDVWSVTGYSVHSGNAQLPLDFAYDLWITQLFKPNKMQKGDVELMIWLFHQNLKPAGKFYPKRSFTAMVRVNGKLEPKVFDVYSSDPNIKNHTSLLVSFAMRDQEGAGSLSGGTPTADLALNLREMLRQMVLVLNGEFGWSKETMNAEYVNGIELGSEFEQVASSAELDWRLAKYCLVIPNDGSSSALSAKDFSCKTPRPVRSR
jgi:Glycosyl hydrolase family 12